MFYEFPPASDNIKQGDIFLNIPRVALEFSQELSILEQEEKTFSLTWQEIVNNKKDVSAVLGLYSVPAIVVSQSCDTLRKEYITLCEIVELSTIKAFNNYEERAPKNIAKDLLKCNSDMPDFFYLPPDNGIGFSNKMAVIFSNTINLLRTDLGNFIDNRKGRLDKTAYEHFREKLSHFYHRYAWKEFYILNKEEINAHGDYSALTTEELYNYQK